MGTDKYKCLVIILFFLLPCTLYAQQVSLPQQTDRWKIQHDGSIIWNVKDSLPHADHIEMSGEKVSFWISYRVDTAAASKIARTVIFPTFRVLPNDTRSHLAYNFDDDELPRIYVNGNQLKISGNDDPEGKQVLLKVKSITQHGIMKISARTVNPLISLERSFFPSATRPLAIEKFELTNNSNQMVTVSMEHLKREETTDTARSKVAAHTVIMETLNAGYRRLKPGQSAIFYICYLATDHPENIAAIDPVAEERSRAQRVAEILSPLQLETPDSILNTEFAFAKIRATESIFNTRGGYIHSPGGLSYYAGIWANDQAEYISPYFAFSGDVLGVRSAMNCYRLFARYMNPAYDRLPCSIVAEGDTIWKDAGDRGDQAMIAYGASRFALAYGNADSARKLWPLIKWCLEYSKRHINNKGVVESDCDELERRFPAGKANLSTNCLYYDALISAAYLSRQLKFPAIQATTYEKEAKALANNIEQYFGADIDGYKTYRYYETNTVLRAWICVPLAMGIYTRSAGTIQALFSPQLWTADGLATEAGKPVFWDRSTLYAFRGVLQAGATEKALAYLKYYSRRRLLGGHVPYPVEAYPEGNQQQLSAESGLYCRIFTEGLFGIRPTGFSEFKCTPRLPKEWDHMALNNIHSFGTVFNLNISRQQDGKILIQITEDSGTHSYKINDGETVNIRL